jgi:hypothetical protein
MEHNPTTHKFVAVVSKKVPAGNAMNAVGHMAAGLVACYDKADKKLDEMRFQDYIDADKGRHPSISDNPFIVLRADNSNQLRTFRNALIEAGVMFTDFTNTMIEGTYADQHQRTNKTPEAELEYFGVCTFGTVEQLNTLTKKFSLWR